MDVIALRPLAGEYGLARRGETLTLSDFRAKQMIARGVAAPVNRRGEVADTAAARPLGFQTGVEQRASSSAEAPAPPVFTSSEAEVTPAPSPSTKDGASRRGQKPSTPAMRRGGNSGRASRNSRG